MKLDFICGVFLEDVVDTTYEKVFEVGALVG
jgi:hypothetical protein